FQLADGSLVDWMELKPALAQVNVAMELSLRVIVAACTGGALAKAVTVTDRAGLWGLIGPTKSISPAELEGSYRAFYTELLVTKSPSAAIKALEAKSVPGMFWRATAQGLFQAAWDGYRSTYCTPEQLHLRSLRMKEAYF